jgi:hypothetical protein
MIKRKYEHDLTTFHIIEKKWYSWSFSVFRRREGRQVVKVEEQCGSDPSGPLLRARPPAGGGAERETPVSG